MSYTPTKSPRNGALRAKSPVYAIDFSSQAAGKRIATSKRRVRWRWGYTNQDALENGQTGNGCRGEEHDVTLVWSVASGKRQVLMDGQEVHYIVSRSNIVDFSWTTKGNHVIKVLAQASPPMSSGHINPDFRQYDLLVDGQSFFTMPKVFELGLRGQPSAQARQPGDLSQYKEESSYAMNRKNNEESDLQRAIQDSIAESRRHLAEKNRAIDNSSYGGNYGGGYSQGGYGNQGGGGGYNQGGYGNQGDSYHQSYGAPSPAPHDQSTTMDLLDFGSETAAPAPTYDAFQTNCAPAPFAAAPVTTAPPAPLALTYTGAQAPHAVPTEAYPQAEPMPYNPASVPPTPTTSAPNTAQFLSPDISATSAPAAYGVDPSTQPQVIHSYDDPFAPKPPTKDEVHLALLGLYAPSTSNAHPVTPETAPVAAQPQPNFGTPSPQNTQSLTMNSPLAIKNDAEEPKSEFDSALSNLVNFDDINAPAENDVKLTMINAEEEKLKSKGKSIAIPPIANNMVGTGATLSQIADVKPTTHTIDPTKIMKPPPPNVFHQDAGHAGALVVHGEGPPPLHPTPFGAPIYGAQAGY